MLIERVKSGAPMTAPVDEDGKQWRKVWLACEAQDRESAAMMNFILAACQQLKRIAYERIERGDRRGSTVPREKTRDVWLAEFLAKYPYAKAAPRYALRSALDKILEEGTRKRPEDRTDWSYFAAEARKGWHPHPRKKKRRTWEQYISGEEVATPKAAITISGTAEEIFRTGEINFRWAKIRLTEAGVKRLAKELKVQEASEEQLVMMVTQIDFAKRKNGWQLNFSFS